MTPQVLGSRLLRHPNRTRRPRVTATFLATSAMAATLLTSSARASDTEGGAPTSSAEIYWQAPAECPDLNGVKRAVERLLGKRLDDLQSSNVQAHGEVRRNEAGIWELHCTLSVSGVVEEETLAAKKCQALADAMTLQVALAIDPLAVVESGAPPAPPALPAPAPVAAPARVRPAQKAANRAAARIGLRAVGGAGLGPLPGVTPGAGLYGSVQFPSFRIELGSQAYWGGVAQYAKLPAVGAHLQAFSGAARACLTSSAAWLTVPVCGGLELGVLRGDGFGIASSETSARLWGALVLGPALRLRVAPNFAFWLEADARVTVLRPEFHVRNLDTLYTPPWGGSLLSAGLEVDFGR
jgi:hypothetical protein